jgi:hypothetical protein
LPPFEARVRSHLRRDPRFIEEALLFSFAPHDDLTDACSRVYDMSPVVPSRWERGEWEPPAHPNA